MSIFTVLPMDLKLTPVRCCGDQRNGGRKKGTEGGMKKGFEGGRKKGLEGGREEGINSRASTT